MAPSAGSAALCPHLPDSEKVPVLVSAGFPGDSLEKNLPANAGNMGSVPWLGGSLEKEMETHSSMLAWRATVYGATENQALVSD